MGLWPSAPHAAVSSTDREAALWEMEEYQLQERHQLVKQQLKDQYFLQRHELLRKHEKVRLPRDGHHLGTTGAPRRSQVGHGEAREVLGGCLASTQGARNRGTVRKLMAPAAPSLPRDVCGFHACFLFLSVPRLSIFSFSCIRILIGTNLNTHARKPFLTSPEQLRSPAWVARAPFTSVQLSPWADDTDNTGR